MLGRRRRFEGAGMRDGVERGNPPSGLAQVRELGAGDDGEPVAARGPWEGAGEVDEATTGSLTGLRAEELPDWALRAVGRLLRGGR